MMATGTVSVSEATTIADALFDGKSAPLPVFLVTFGPPGSGKSAIVQAVLDARGMAPDATVEVLVDSIVERMPGYRADMAAAAATSDPVAAAERVYFRYRHAGGDAISENVLERALLGRYHVVWETTGNSIDWTVRTIERAKRANYHIVLVYPYVGEAALAERVRARARTVGRTVAPKRISQNVAHAQRNFEVLVPLVDEAIVYDNAGGIDELGVLMQLQNRYQGFCRAEDTRCQYGVATAVSCDVNRLCTRRSTMTPDYAAYLLSLCGVSHCFPGDP